MSKLKTLTTWQAPFLMNLDSYEWSPTMISFNSNPDDTAKSTSWHVYNVSLSNHKSSKNPVNTNRPSK